MELHGTVIEETFAEAFRMWAGRLIVTAIDPEWVRIAVAEVCGYGTSVIGCDAEAGLEQWLERDQTPDGRPGAAVLFFAFNAEKLAKAIPNRVGQCLMTCPTTAVYDGMPGVSKSEDSARLDLGKRLRFFGDGQQKSKLIAGRRFWRVPVMDGEFTIEETCGAVKAIGGGNLLIGGQDQATTLASARRAVAAIAPLADVITPFPGGVVRSGSKVGARYKGMFASTNDEYCPTLRSKAQSKLRPGVGCVYEIVINGLSQSAIASAMRAGIEAACGPQTLAISAGNYGGNLGKFHFKLHEIMASIETAHKPLPPVTPTHGGYVLTWKSGSLAPVDGSLFRPDTLGQLDRAALAATPVRLGRTQVPLGSLFEIAGQAGGPVLTLRGLPPLARLGANMAGGELIIEGDAGDQVGASMRGGILRVRGNAGHRAGGPDANAERGMTGGELLIEGNAGDFAGLRMRRGLLAVRGCAGRSPGYRMLAGTLVLGRGPLDSPGLEMRRGTIICLDRAAAVAGAPGLAQESLFPATAAPVLRLLLRCLAALGWPVDPAAMEGVYALWSGDRFELAKGEVWQWRS